MARGGVALTTASVLLLKTTLVGLARYIRTAHALASREQSLVLFLRGLLLLRRLLCLSTGAHPLPDLYLLLRCQHLKNLTILDPGEPLKHGIFLVCI